MFCIVERATGPNSSPLLTYDGGSCGDALVGLLATFGAHASTTTATVTMTAIKAAATDAAVCGARRTCLTDG